MKIPLTKHQAAALGQAIAENNQAVEIANLRLGLTRRQVNVLVLDAGGKPEDIAGYSVQEEGGESFLVIQEAPKPTSPEADPKA